MNSFEKFDAKHICFAPEVTCGIIGTAAALGIGLAASAGASVASGVMGAKAAGKAAKTQADASIYAADLQRKFEQEALAYQREKDALARNDAMPWLTAGSGAVTQLSSLMQPGGELYRGWTEEFKAPTAADMQVDPGYAFRLSEGQKALERSAAAKGGLLSGGTLKALTRYGQDMGSQEYNNTYNRAFNEYANRYNVFNNNQANRYNRLAGLSGGGQTTATNLASLGQTSANNVGNILSSSATNQGQLAQDAAAARASGYVGAANAWGNTMNNLGSLGLLYGMGALNQPGKATNNGALMNAYIPQIRW